ncbi:hypothetical protein [Chitinimonas sp.]|uniref:hypothetical protein n=1 Tax=Chitinimonas sp. TaxID=1934313 RepID=UPI0035AD8A07
MKFLIPALMMTASLAALAERGSLIDMRIEDRDGGTFREYRHRGSAWVAGEQGQDYQIRLRNLSGERVLVVLSVDGVNAISGQAAGYQQTGYVLGPYQETRVIGWRKSLDTAARFYFTQLSDSYAARTDRPDNVGVIGAAVFREKRYVPPQTMAEAAPMPGGRARSKSMAREESMGTGHGQIEESQVNRTSFDRDSSMPYESVAIRYDSYRHLAEAGVIRGRWHEEGPNPFPREGGFTPDPPRFSEWRQRPR